MPITGTDTSSLYRAASLPTINNNTAIGMTRQESVDDFSLDLSAVKIKHAIHNNSDVVQIPRDSLEQIKERVRGMGDSIEALKEENDELYNMLDVLSLNNSSTTEVIEDAISEEQEQKLIKTIMRLRSERNHYRQMWEQMNIRESLSSPNYVHNAGTTPNRGPRKVNLIRRVRDYIKSNTPVNDRNHGNTMDMMNYGWSHPKSGVDNAPVQSEHVFFDSNAGEYQTHLNLKPGQQNFDDMSSVDEHRTCAGERIIVQ
ncbi:lplB [Acrasis kona]|uniref:LplB n=1 Tax=Acrasis kona TaxID=1008807 RepID=A0AAW2ZD62_9EUKA